MSTSTVVRAIRWKSSADEFNSKSSLSNDCIMISDYSIDGSGYKGILRYQAHILMALELLEVS